LNIVGLENPLLDLVTIYPNPCKEILTITTKSNEVMKAIFFNIQGQKIKSVDLPNSTNIIELKDLSPGVYWVQVELFNHLLTQKCIIE
jgi:hypothetical protein